MTYRDDLEAAQARIRTLEAELEAERERCQAAEAATRASEAARDELKLKGASPTAKSRRPVVLLLVGVAGGLLLGTLGAVLFLTGAQEPQIPDQADPFFPEDAGEPPKPRIDELEGQVSINSIPPTTVYLDGSPIGTTPLRAKLPPGEHWLEMQAPGYEILRRKLHVRAGEALVVTSQLTPRTER